MIENENMRLLRSVSRLRFTLFINHTSFQYFDVVNGPIAIVSFN